MEETTRIKLPVSKVQVGMKIAEDVYTPKGLMLIPKHTILDEKHIFRIKLYQILSVFVLVSTEAANDDESVREVLSTAFEYEITQNFSDFKERYVIHHAMTEKKLHDINEGGVIDEDDLFDVSKVLIDSLRSKSELFNYMYHLREEDDYTYTHCLNVSILSNIFAKWLKLSDQQVKEVTVAGLLHDVGKMKIDLSILNKPSKLTDEEFEIIKQHTTLGYETIKQQTIPNSIKSGVLFHHEKMDGSGYPLGLKQEQIPLYAKIIGIVDIYDAMTSNRSYHSKFSPFKVIRMFEQESYGLLDTKLLFVFLENIAYNYLGKDVILSTGDKARIVFIHNQSPSRPIVQIQEKMVDLMFEPTISINEIL